IAGIVERHLQALLGGADRAGSELEATDVQDVEGDLVSLPYFAEDRAGADVHVLQDELARRRSTDAELLLLGAGREARRRALDQERREVLAVDLGEHREQVREAGIGDELLRAGQAIAAVGLAVGACLGGERIAAGAGLRERIGGEPLAARELRQIPLLLIFAAIVDGRERSDAGVRAPRDAERCAEGASL